eukprot:COSAG01_NODE_7747_length_3073_cov_17.446537_4_plen_87_part_00
MCFLSQLCGPFRGRPPRRRSDFCVDLGFFFGIFLRRVLWADTWLGFEVSIGCAAVAWRRLWTPRCTHQLRSHASRTARGRCGYTLY